MKYFLSCDWGTTNFRLRLIEADNGRTIDEVVTDQGISKTYQEWLAADDTDNNRINFYRKFLYETIQKLPPSSLPKNLSVIISGMASSSIGMKELAYGKLPFTLDPGSLNTFHIEADKTFPYPIIMVSGCSTDTDIMRGEETILMGCDGDNAENVLYILPGTHSKHITVNRGVVTTFKTYVTGELFELLVQRSVLSNSVTKGIDESSFLKGVNDALGNNLLNSIFSVRAKHILQQSSPIANYQYLSGLVIGTELKDLKTNLTTNIRLASDGQLLSVYALALQTIGITNIELIHAKEAFVKGHLKLIRHKSNH